MRFGPLFPQVALTGCTPPVGPPRGTLDPRPSVANALAPVEIRFMDRGAPNPHVWFDVKLWEKCAGHAADEIRRNRPPTSPSSAWGLSAVRERQIGQLSGSQQQRSVLAQALLHDSPVTFLDVPFQGVDAVTEKAVIDIPREPRDRNRKLVVHHDLEKLC